MSVGNRVMGSAQCAGGGIARRNGVARTLRAGTYASHRAGERRRRITDRHRPLKVYQLSQAGESSLARRPPLSPHVTAPSSRKTHSHPRSVCALHVHDEGREKPPADREPYCQWRSELPERLAHSHLSRHLMCRVDHPRAQPLAPILPPCPKAYLNYELSHFEQT